MATADITKNAFPFAIYYRLAGDLVRVHAS